MDGLMAMRWLDSVVATIAGLPVGVHALVAAGMLTGLVLWLKGERVLKPAFLVLGAVLGAGLGSVGLPAAHPEPIQNIPSVYVGMGGGAIVGLMGSLVAFRAAMAIAALMVFASAGGLAAMVYLARTGELPPEATTSETTLETPSLSEFTEPARIVRDQASTEQQRDDALLQVGQRVERFAADVRMEVERRWSALSGHGRAVLAGSVMGGAVLGLIVGLGSPRRSAAMVTALAGSAVVLASSDWLVRALWPSLLEGREPKPAVLLAVWVVMATIGAVVQLRGRKPDKPAEPKAAEPAKS